MKNLSLTTRKQIFWIIIFASVIFVAMIKTGQVSYQIYERRLEATKTAAPTVTAEALGLHYQKALANMNVGRWLQAKAELDVIFEVDPNYKEVQANLIEVEAKIAELKLTFTPTPEGGTDEMSSTPEVSDTPIPILVPTLEGACNKPDKYPKVYRKYEPTQNAEILSLPHPGLTPDAIEHKDEAVGKMTIRLILAPCGVMEHMIFYGHVPYGLTVMAQKAAQQIKFRPAVHNGQPVPQEFAVEYEFYKCADKPICTKVTEVVE